MGLSRYSIIESVKEKLNAAKFRFSFFEPKTCLRNKQPVLRHKMIRTGKLFVLELLINNPIVFFFSKIP
jgi:hypothetical protein